MILLTKSDERQVIARAEWRRKKFRRIRFRWLQSQLGPVDICFLFPLVRRKKFLVCIPIWIICFIRSSLSIYLLRITWFTLLENSIYFIRHIFCLISASLLLYLHEIWAENFSFKEPNKTEGVGTVSFFVSSWHPLTIYA